MAAAGKILVVEDTDEIAKLVQMSLADAGFEVTHVANGTDGLSQASDGDYSMVILDVMLPGMDGLEICKRLRAAGKTVPLLMLTAKREEVDKVIGLELGADDYLTKPFGVRELVARVRAVLRRYSVANDTAKIDPAATVLDYKNLVIDLVKGRVTLNGKDLDLTQTEYELLTYLASKPGEHFTREQLIHDVWGYDSRGYEHTVNSHINRLRGKIETDPAKPTYVKTVWGKGYRFTRYEELD